MKKKCPVFEVTDFIGKKWALEILVQLCKNKYKAKRYSEIKSKLKKVNPRSFSSRLKELKKIGLIKKKINAKTFPIKSEYSLTESGRDFIKVIDAMKKWSTKWKCKDKECEKISCFKCER